MPEEFDRRRILVVDDEERMVRFIRMNLEHDGFQVAEAFTGTPGKYVRTADTIRSFKEILDGKCDELPEQAFYMVGAIEEARAKAEKMKS